MEVAEALNIDQERRDESETPNIPSLVSESTLGEPKEMENNVLIENSSANPVVEGKNNELENQNDMLKNQGDAPASEIRGTGIIAPNSSNELILTDSSQPKLADSSSSEWDLKREVEKNVPLKNQQNQKKKRNSPNKTTGGLVARKTNRH